jgi:hypothetical protein
MIARTNANATRQAVLDIASSGEFCGGDYNAASGRYNQRQGVLRNYLSTTGDTVRIQAFE